MEQFDRYSKASKASSFSSVSPNDRSSTTICGDGYVYMGPLTAQQYEIPSKCANGISNKAISSTVSSSSSDSQPLSSSSVETTTRNNQYQFKVMLLGDSGVGKTCLLVRFNNETFLTGSFIATVGIDYRTKLVTLGDKKINLQIFDTAGQERFRSITHSYYRNADALLLLYDVTSYSSFENISAWLSTIKECTHDDVMIMLIGNKVDKCERVIPRTIGENLAKEFQISFLETSAKTGQNVELAFMATAQALLDRELHRNKIHSSSKDKIKINVKNNDAETNDGCC